MSKKIAFGIVGFAIVFIVFSILPFLTDVYAQTPDFVGLKITSHTTGQQVPAGELTISGISTDNETTDCTVYADWNNLKPFQTAVATGPGGVNDYSTWRFTYTDKYHLITNGTNELTSKLTCISNPTNLTKWYSVNVIGLASGQNQQQPIPIVANSTTLSNSTISGNGTTKTAALSVGAAANEDIKDILPRPIVQKEIQALPIVANSTTLSNSTISGNNTATTTAALTVVAAANEDIKDILPRPIVQKEIQALPIVTNSTT